MIIFAYPLAFALLVVPFIIHRLVPPAKGMHGDALRVPFLNDIAQINLLSGGLWGQKSDAKTNIFGYILLYIAWIFLCLAVARPQWVGEPVRIGNYGRDIMLVMDISTSMLEPDFSFQNRRIDRLTAVKIAADSFIKERTEDRIGLILFGTRAYLQTPITFDKQSVLDVLWSVDAGMAGNSTSIGDAVGMALKKLSESKTSTQNKIIILLTDGENNDGSLSMPEVLKLAKDENIKIYTIGVSGENRLIASFFGIKVPQVNGLDEKSLQALASETKGNYFRATDTKALQQIYKEIDKLEPTMDKEQYVQEHKEVFYYPLAVSLLFVLALLALQRRKV